MDRKNDDRWSAAVAGLAVTGTLGLLLLAGCGSRDESASGGGGRAASPPAAQAETASFERPAETLPEVASPELSRPSTTGDPVADGLAAWSERQYEVAADAFGVATEGQSDRAWTWYMRGLSEWKAGRLDGAVRSMERSRELAPDSVKTLVNLSRIQNDREAYEEALEAARAALALGPDSAEALFLEGRSLNNLGRTTEAEQALVRSLEVDPANGYARNLLGLVRLESGDAEGAVEPLQQASESLPGVAYVWNNLGMALERTGRRDEAIAAYRRALETGDGHERARSNLARLGASATGADPVVVATGDDTTTREH